MLIYDFDHQLYMLTRCSWSCEECCVQECKEKL